MHGSVPLDYGLFRMVCICPILVILGILNMFKNKSKVSDLTSEKNKINNKIQCLATSLQPGDRLHNIV